MALREEELFPALSASQLERVAVHGHRRHVDKDVELITAGQRVDRFFVVTNGYIEIVRTSADGGEDLIVQLRPGQFSGELTVLSGRRGLVTLRAGEPSDVIEVDRHDLLNLVQADSDLSDLFMRAFLLRRTSLVEQHRGDVVLVGSMHSPETLRVKEFLTRNGHPYTYLDLDHENDAQALLDRFSVRVTDIPVLICSGKTTLRNPSNKQIADCLGFNVPVDQTTPRDVVVIGAGPAGLATAVYSASEGLDVLVFEGDAPGGQAGASSKIENYLGFPTGISGQQLAEAAYAQALKFGAQVIVAKKVARLLCDQKPYTIAISDGSTVTARSIVIASGAEYRTLPLSNLHQFENAGVYYGATQVESQVCEGQDVVVVGGGNSAGQAAVFLAQKARHVHILVRSSGLAESMSRYLIRRIEESPTITLHAHTEIVALEGQAHLERLRWRDARTGEEETHEIQHIFLMMGAKPNTAWLEGCLELDTTGFIKTGTALSSDDLGHAHWPLARAPHLLETSIPGVFAVGDVRCGSVKRVASAVGEGSIAVSFVHQVLRE